MCDIAKPMTRMQMHSFRKRGSGSAAHVRRVFRLRAPKLSIAPTQPPLVHPLSSIAVTASASPRPYFFYAAAPSLLVPQSLPPLSLRVLVSCAHRQTSRRSHHHRRRRLNSIGPNSPPLRRRSRLPLLFYKHGYRQIAGKMRGARILRC